MTEANTIAPEAGQAPSEAPINQQSSTEAPKSWYDGHGLKDEDVGYIQNKNWKNPAELVNSYRNLEKFHGVPAEQLIKLPKDLADEKAIGEVYNRLGRPESADKYDYKAGEGVQLDAGRLGWAKNIAHKMGLNNQQFKALIDETIGYESGLMSEAEQELVRINTEQLNSLKKEWGSAFQEREVLGQRAVRAFVDGDEATKNKTLGAIEGAIGTAAMLKLFSNIGERLGEDKIIATTGDKPFGYTPQQAMADKKSLMSELADPANKSRLDLYNKGQGKDYEKMQQLIKISIS